MEKATFALIHNPGCPGYWHEIVKAKDFFQAQLVPEKVQEMRQIKSDKAGAAGD